MTGVREQIFEALGKKRQKEKLTKEQERMLEEKRKAGRFGGAPCPHMKTVTIETLHPKYGARRPYFVQRTVHDDDCLCDANKDFRAGLAAKAEADVQTDGKIQCAAMTRGGSGPQCKRMTLAKSGYCSIHG